MTTHEQRRHAGRRNHFWRLAAYVLLVALGVVGFHSIDVEAQRRCRATNANSRALRELVYYSTRNSTAPPPPGTPESVLELIRRGRSQADQLRRYTDAHVKVQACRSAWPR